MTLTVDVTLCVTKLTGCMRHLILLTAAAVCGNGLELCAQDQPAPVSPGLRYARRDAERAAAGLKAEQAKAAAAVETLAKAQAAVTAAQQAVTAADQAVASTTAAHKAAETALSAANQAAADAAAKAKQAADDAAVPADAKEAAQLAATKAAEAAVAAQKTLDEALAAKTTAAAQKTAADKQLVDAQAAIKPATDAKAEADKALVPFVAVEKSAADRLANLEKTPAAEADFNQIRLWQTFTHNRPAMVVSIDPSGDYLWTGSQDNLIVRWDVAQPGKVATPGQKGWSSDFTFGLPDSGRLYTAGFTGAVQAWSTRDGALELTKTLAAHRGQVRAVVVSPDGKLLATSGNDKLVKIWDAEGNLLKELPGHANHVYNLAFHPDGRHLVSGDLMGVVKHWDAVTWELVREIDAGRLHKYDPTFQADCGGIRGIDFSPDGRYLALGGIAEVSNAFAGIGRPAVLLIDWHSGQTVHELLPKGGFQGSVWSLEFHPSGKFLAAAGGGGSGAMWFWNLTQPAADLDFALPAVAYDMAIHPDGLRIAVALYDNTVRLYDLGPKLSDAK